MLTLPIGHDASYQKLCHLTVQGRGVLLAGGEGIGKKALVHYWLAARWCTDLAKPYGTCPCGTCSVCIQVMAGTAPDMRLITPVKGVIPIAKVREAKAWASLAAFYGNGKCLIIDDAHTMQKPAANALLKLLEEPPQGLIIFLISSVPNRLLATLRSRCLWIVCRPPQWTSELANYLQEKLPDCSPDLLRTWHQIFCGGIGQLMQGSLAQWEALRQLLLAALFSGTGLQQLIQSKDWQSKDWLAALVAKKEEGLVFDLIAYLLREAWFSSISSNSHVSSLHKKADLLTQARSAYRSVLNQELFWEDFVYRWCERQKTGAG